MSSESGRKDCNFQQLRRWGQELAAVSAGRAWSCSGQRVGWRPLGGWGFPKGKARLQSLAGGGWPAWRSQPHGWGTASKPGCLGSSPASSTDQRGLSPPLCPIGVIT